MPVLHNRISNKILKENMLAIIQKRTTISFYKYINIQHPNILRNEWYLKFKALNIFGRIYIAKEGINAQISVPNSNVEVLRQVIYNTRPELNHLRLNIAIDDNGQSFWVLRIKVRESLVSDGIIDKTFNASNIGKYLQAHEVNKMIHNPNTLLIDMRNHYEYEVGHFENALEIPSDTFREQLPMVVNMLQTQKNKTIIMYCTGGIRCEKASAYMLHNGFKNVYHVEGGVIEYVRQAKKQGLPIYFKGKNFVFDNRMGERITDDILAQCHQCGEACDAHTNCKNNDCHLLFIQCLSCAKKYKNCCSVTCTKEIQLSEKEKHIRRSGLKIHNTRFNKSRRHLSTLFKLEINNKMN
ncbi:hypothetical protein GFV14_00460 [Candidatus Hartigia pinicola]|nr:hypothetical protein GFV14_00460 [Candidatus Hartigia pinicola]